MQCRIVKDGAQTTLLAYPAHRRNNGGLVKIVGEHVNFGGLIPLAVGDEVEQRDTRVSAEPCVLGLEWLGVEIERLRPSRPNIRVLKLVGVGLGGNVAAREGRAELGMERFDWCDPDVHLWSRLGGAVLPGEIERAHTIGDWDVKPVRRHIDPSKLLERGLVRRRPLTRLSSGFLVHTNRKADAVLQSLLSFPVVLPPDREASEILIGLVDAD